MEKYHVVVYRMHVILAYWFWFISVRFSAEILTVAHSLRWCRTDKLHYT